MADDRKLTGRFSQLTITLALAELVDFQRELPPGNVRLHTALNRAIEEFRDVLRWHGRLPACGKDVERVVRPGA